MSLQDPKLGTITGVKKGATTQFLGIQYATLAHGFAVAELKEDYGGKIDATKISPTVVTTDGIQQEFGIIQKAIPAPDYPGRSATEGLTLNITVPEGAKASDRLPVVAFLHGGAFVFGANYYPHYDGERLVSLSVAEGKPVIAITINYRLGLHGFLDSKVLRDAGFPANRGIRDQWTAFKWIQKHIAAFGGDPKAVTAAGQSAGSVAVLLALNSPDELFQRAFCLSGNPLMYPILPLAIAEFNAAKALAALGLADLPAEEQVQRLIATSPDDLLAKVHPSTHMGPTIDDVIRGPPTYANLADSLQELPGAAWCSSLFIGSMDLDAHVFSFLGLFNDRGPIASAFIDRFKKAVPSDKLDALFAVYGLAPATLDDAAQLAILKFGTDLKYFSTGVAYARAWPGKSYLYQFKEVNTWDGPFKGHAGHVLDVAYLFQNYNHELTEEQAKVAKLFGRDLAVFAHGEDPFPTFADGKGGRVYGSDASAIFVSDVDSLGPSGEVRKLWEEIGIQDLSQAWDLFLTRQ